MESGLARARSGLLDYLDLGEYSANEENLQCVFSVVLYKPIFSFLHNTPYKKHLRSF